MRSRLIMLTTAVVLAAAGLAAAIDLKDITYDTKGAGKVVFSHTSHLQKKSRTTSNLSCKTCHDSTKGKNVHFTMADMEKGKSCGACHNGKKAFAVANCTQCHKVRDITYNIKETGSLQFSHTNHLRGGMQCNSCHDKLFNTGANPKATMAAMKKGKSCGACHDGKRAFSVDDCAKCHPVREISYRVKGAGNVPFSHKLHTGLYGCEECHPALYAPGKKHPEVTMTQMEAQKSCGACHDGKIAFTVKANCARCHKV